jgi:hypothetical protein
MNNKTAAKQNDLQPDATRIQVPANLPENERWLFENPQTLRDLEEALAWSMAHPADDSTTEAILKKMAE